MDTLRPKVISFLSLFVVGVLTEIVGNILSPDVERGLGVLGDFLEWEWATATVLIVIGIAWYVYWWHIAPRRQSRPLGSQTDRRIPFVGSTEPKAAKEGDVWIRTPPDEPAVEGKAPVPLSSDVARHVEAKLEDRLSRADADGVDDEEPSDPPGLVGFSGAARRAHVEKMCSERAQLSREVDELLARLEKVEAHQGEGGPGSDELETAVSRWRRAADNYARMWWGKSREEVSREVARLPDGPRIILPPEWRVRLLRSMLWRRTWIQKHGAQQCATEPAGSSANLAAHERASLSEHLRWREEHEAVTREGRGLANALRDVDAYTLDDEQRKEWQERGRAWLARCAAYWDRWWGDDMKMARGMSKAYLAIKGPPLPALGPPWRRSLLAEIQTECNWLDEKGGRMRSS